MELPMKIGVHGIGFRISFIHSLSYSLGSQVLFLLHVNLRLK